MTAHNHGSAVERGAVTDPILATPLWRPKPSRQPHVVTEAAADPHKHDWAGPGFSKPGPEPDVGYHTGHTRRKAEASGHDNRRGSAARRPGWGGCRPRTTAAPRTESAATR
jgi:hypothetical protein